MENARNVIMLEVNKDIIDSMHGLCQTQCSLILQISYLVNQVNNEAITWDGADWPNTYLVEVKTICYHTFYVLLKHVNVMVRIKININI